MTLHVHLGHGASGTAASMQPWVEGLRRRGFLADAVDLPKRRAEDAVAVWQAAVPGGTDVVVGGHSYGGRVASLAAAAGTSYRALVLLSYPLHRPGGPETWDVRTAHWPAIGCPVLLQSGESDPFARIDLLRTAVGRLRHGELVTYPRLGHTLAAVREQALERIARFLSDLPGESSRP